MSVIRMLLGALLAAVALFFWGFVYWAATGVGMTGSEALPADLTAALNNGLTDGLFYFPDPHGDPADAEASGPFIEIYYRSNVTYMAPKFLLQGFVHYLGTALLAAILMSSVIGSLPTYVNRVAFGFLLGLFSAFFIELSDPIWFFHPWAHHFVVAIYQLVMGLILGLILGIFVRPPATAPEAA